MATGQAQTRTASGPFASWAMFVQDFGQAWIAYGVLTVAVAGITHGIFHIPLWQVADVILALFLFYVAFVGSLSFITFCLDIVGGELILGLGRLLSMALLPLLPFAVIFGFLIYGFLSEQDFEKTSFVYQGFIGLFASGYDLLAGATGDYLNALKSVPAANGATSRVVDQERIVLVLKIASVLIALFGIALSRSRVTFVADDTLRISPFVRWVR